MTATVARNTKTRSKSH